MLIGPLLVTKNRTVGARLKASVASLLAPWYGDFDAERASDMRSLLEVFVEHGVVSEVQGEAAIDFGSEMYSGASAHVGAI